MSKGAAVLVCCIVYAGCRGTPRPVDGDGLVEATRIAEAQRAGANADVVRRGERVFLEGSCAMCHTVRGTIALARVGPDLTHVGSRKTLAAGTIYNTRGHLTGWILNPQNVKPGTQMPPTLLASEDLHAVVSYLESLR